MIRKNDEAGNSKTSFKRFSDMNNVPNSTAKSDQSEEISPDNGDRPGLPNLPYRSTKKPKSVDTKNLKPIVHEEEDDNDIVDEFSMDDNNENQKVRLYGKVAKLPKGVKASKGFNFLESVKVSKSSIWYLMVEKDNDLQMVKYNYKKGVDLSKFINELKSYYTSKYKDNKEVVKLIEAIEIDGNDKYSWIKHIPLIEVDGKKVITKITEDLIRLLSK